MVVGNGHMDLISRMRDQFAHIIIQIDFDPVPANHKGSNTLLPWEHLHIANARDRLLLTYPVHLHQLCVSITMNHHPFLTTPLLQCLGLILYIIKQLLTKIIRNYFSH